SRRVSAAAIARAANVSPATVSYVLNGRAGVSDATRAHVLALAAEMGLGTPVSAKSTGTFTVGLVLPSAYDPAHGGMAAEFSRMCSARGYRSLLTYADETADSLTDALATMLDGGAQSLALTVANSSQAAALRYFRSNRVQVTQLLRSAHGPRGNFVGI